MIKFLNVNKVWPNGTHALKDVNLTIPEGEFVAIIGLSGAGKTTLLRTINKMNDISSGRIVISFSDDVKHKEYIVNRLYGHKLRKLRSKIGLISQSYNNIPTQTVLRNVLNARISKMNFFRALIQYFNRHDKTIALESLEKLNILENAYVRCGNLSGGQQQRVALARTIAQEPKIIIADEPVSALDPVLANQVMQDFKKINEMDKMTIVINIHHVDLALKYCTRVLGVRAGEVVYDGPTSEVNQDVLKKIYGDDYKFED